MFFTPNGCCLRKRRKRTLQFLFYLNPSFTKGGKKIKHPLQETILIQRGGVWSDRWAPQLQGASLFSCPPEAVPRARIPPGSRVPEGPLSSPGAPFSASFRPLARSGGLGLAPTLTTSEWAGEGGQPRPARPLTLTSALAGQSKTPGLPPAWGKKTSHGTQPAVLGPHSGVKT